MTEASKPTPRFPDMPFLDQVWRITFEDGREPAYVAVYNNEISAWTDNAPDDMKEFAGYFSPRVRRLSGQGMAFWFEGFNE